MEKEPVKGIEQLRFETKVMGMLWNEYNKYGENFDEVKMELFMDHLHQCLENAAMDFAKDLDIDYTPQF